MTVAVAVAVAVLAGHPGGCSRNMLHKEALAQLKLSPNPMHLTVVTNGPGWAAFQRQAYSSAAQKQTANPAVRAATVRSQLRHFF